MYLFYVDESGQRDFHETGSRHFALGAVGIAEADWRAVNQQINALKVEVFRTRRVEFKSVRLRNLEKQKKHYLDPFGLTVPLLTEAIERLYAVLMEAPVTLFAVVIDKQQMRERAVSPNSITEYAHELLVERFEEFLCAQTEKHFGVVIHDLIQETTGPARSHQREIINLHDQILCDGRTATTEIVSMVEGVHFIETDQSNFLQIADLAAYNVYRHFSDNWKDWDRLAAFPEEHAFSTMGMYPYFARLLPKFHRNAEGLIRGCGIKKQPNE